jgi:MarR family transcriptional regulator, organic hydroperoxide resistance regulator
VKTKDNTFSVAKAEDSSGFLLWQVTSLWQRGIKVALEPFDLTHSQFVLLASAHWLSLGDHQVTQIMLSEHSKIDPMTTSQVLRTLAAKGFIVRTEHATDTRAKSITVTYAGKNRIKPAVVAVENFDHDFFSRIKSGVNAFNQHLRTLLADELTS